jgi:site-specific recombinase XerD
MCRRGLNPGYHIVRKKRTFCSVTCYEAFRKKSPKVHACEWCGTEFYPFRRAKVIGCCPAHRTLILGKQKHASKCGPLLARVDEFLRHVKPQYEENSLRSLRSTLDRFCEFLISRGTLSFEEVRPLTIAEFLVWSVEQKCAGKVCFISYFFQWLIAHEYVVRNPVLPQIHKEKPSRRKPRPFSDAERKEIWTVLEQHGTPLLRAWCALGEDCGPRYGEVQRITLDDLDLDAQQVFISLPNKGKTEEWVPFGDKALRYLREWLTVRPLSQSRRVFVRDGGIPLGNGYVYRQLRELFRRVLGDPGYPTWWNPFAFHRFRHSMASRLTRAGADLSTVMTVGRWSSVAGLEHYVDLRPEDLVRAYAEAVRRDKEGGVKRTESLSAAEYIKAKRKAA